MSGFAVVNCLNDVVSPVGTGCGKAELVLSNDMPDKDVVAIVTLSRQPSGPCSYSWNPFLLPAQSQTKVSIPTLVSYGAGATPLPSGMQVSPFYPLDPEWSSQVGTVQVTYLVLKAQGSIDATTLASSKNNMGATLSDLVHWDTLGTMSFTLNTCSSSGGPTSLSSTGNGQLAMYRAQQVQVSGYSAAPLSIGSDEVSHIGLHFSPISDTVGPDLRAVADDGRSLVNILMLVFAGLFFVMLVAFLVVEHHWWKGTRHPLTHRHLGPKHRIQPEPLVSDSSLFDAHQHFSHLMPGSTDGGAEFRLSDLPRFHVPK